MLDAILTGHDHCYQRFTFKHEKQQLGAGGFATYDDLSRIREDHFLPDRVRLEAFNDTGWRFQPDNCSELSGKVRAFTGEL